MKNKTSKLMLACSLGIALPLSAQWNPSTSNAGTDIFRTGKVGINMSAAPQTYALEVNGSIGLGFGSHIGVANSSLTEKKILEVSWDATVGDYVSLYTPGQTGYNNLEKMRLIHDGRVSIGAGSNPDAKFDFQYTTATLGTNQGSTLMLSRFSAKPTANNNFQHNTWLVRNATSNSDWTTVSLKDGLSIDASFLDASANGNVKTWWSRDPYNDVQAWGTAQQVYMSLDQGKMGLNVNYSTSPLASRGRFQVEETNGNIKAFVSKTKHNGGYGYSIVADVDHDKTFAFRVVNRNLGASVPGGTAGQVSETFGVYGDGQTVISTVATDALLIQNLSDPNGAINFKVGKTGRTIIGPQTILSNHIHANAFVQVSGKLACKELVVVDPTKWADFVFADDYKLNSLSDVEAFYKTNKHLPDVPSEKEVMENGINSAEMDAVLIQKIEELTLYVVDLNKKLEVLQKENALLKEQK